MRCYDWSPRSQLNWEKWASIDPSIPHFQTRPCIYELQLGHEAEVGPVGLNVVHATWSVSHQHHQMMSEKNICHKYPQIALLSRHPTWQNAGFKDTPFPAAQHAHRRRKMRTLAALRSQGSPGRKPKPSSLGIPPSTFMGDCDKLLPIALMQSFRLKIWFESLELWTKTGT